MIPPVKAHAVAVPKTVASAPGPRTSAAPFSLSAGLPRGALALGSAHGHGVALSAPVSTTSLPSAMGKGEGRPSVDDPLDPLERRRAFDMGFFPASPSAMPIPTAIEIVHADASQRVAPSMEVLLPALVRRIAWSGDARRGSVRLEVGSGPLAGGVLLVHADGANVSVHLDAPAGADKAEWQQRITRALEGRGLQATVEVD